MQARNEVFVTGRLAAEPEERELPSGDALTSWRLVVDRRAQPSQAAGGDPRDDAGHPRLRRVGGRGAAAASRAGSRVTSSRSKGRCGAGSGGRPGGGVASRYEIEVLKAKRVAKAA